MWGWKAVLIGLVVGCVSCVPRAEACDPCGVHSSVQVPGLMNALRTTGLQPHGVTLGVQEQVSTFRVRGDNDLRTTEEGLELIRTLSVSQFSLAYNPSSDLAVQVNAPLIARWYDRFERYQKVQDSEFGFGDTSIVSTYSPYSHTEVDRRFFVAGMAGVKLPTGDTGSLKRIAENDGTDPADRIQGRGLTLGSGSVDFPVGVVAYGREDRWVLFGSAQYTFRTEGTAGYQFANDLNWSVGPGWLFVVGEEESLTLSAVISGEHKGSDHLDGELLPRTAASNIYLGPELFYALNGKLSLQLAFDMPIAVDVGGAAVKPETRTRLGVGWSF